MARLRGTRGAREGSNVEIEKLSEGVDRVSRLVYERERERMVVDCLDLLSSFQEELEEGVFPPADEADEQRREHLVAALRLAELELERWTTSGRR